MVDWVIPSVVANTSSLIPSLVDKVIISQNSLRAFINTVCPGAYASITKINFKSLDQYAIKPVGVYGSKEEIVRFLLELGVADDTVYVVYYILCANPYDSFLGLHNCLRTRALWDKQSGFFALDCTFFDQSNSRITRSKSLSFTGPRKALGMTRHHLKAAEIA